MILWSSKVDTESKVTFEHMGLRSWQHHLKLETEPSRWALHLSYGPTLTCGKWEEPRELHPHWDLSVRFKQWGFGYDSFYYDGDHRSITLGPFWLYWFR